MTELGDFGIGNSRGQAINPAGQIVGYGGVPDGLIRAVLYDRGSVTELGTLGSEFEVDCFAYDINPAKQIVGTCTSKSTGVSHAFLWQKGVMTNLGTGDATAINPAGQIAGIDPRRFSDVRHAVVWQKGLKIDLGTLGGTYSEAHGISAGQVVGESAIANGDTHATLWMVK